jgi:hypothetical protein
MMQAPGSDMPSAGVLLAAILGSLPIVGMVVWGAVKIAGPVSQALARRIGGTPEISEELRVALAQVQQELEQIRGELGETQERLDFAERLLAQGRASQSLESPRG